MASYQKQSPGQSSKITPEGSATAFRSRRLPIRNCWIYPFTGGPNNPRYSKILGLRQDFGMLLDMQTNNERAQNIYHSCCQYEQGGLRYIQKPWSILDVEWRDGSELLQLQVGTSPPTEKYRGFKSLNSRRQIRRLTERKADKRNNRRCFDELLRGREVDVSQLKHIYCEFKMVPDNRSTSQSEIAWR